jgi:hypothetical protein
MLATHRRQVRPARRLRIHVPPANSPAAAPTAQRCGEVKLFGELLPQVLSRYGASSNQSRK